MKIKLNIPRPAVEPITQEEITSHPNVNVVIESKEDIAFRMMADKANKPHIREPLVYDFSKHGVTQSLLSKWRECPTKARMYLQGYYRPGTGIALTFGNMFHHLCEKFYTKVKNHEGDNEEHEVKPAGPVNMSPELIEEMLRRDFDDEYQRTPAEDRGVFEEAILFCKIVFPEYLDYWKGDFSGEKKKNWVALEKQFAMPTHGSNFIGKRDGEYKDQSGNLWLFETKTKSRWNELYLGMIIARDIQVNSYMLAQKHDYNEMPVGVLYNVVRRPQLRQKKDENREQFGNRIREDVQARKEFYFTRLEVPILADQVVDFEGRFNQELSDFVEWSKRDPKLDRQCNGACESVYGPCDFLKYCHSGKKDAQGLSVRKKMFNELAEEEMD